MNASTLMHILLPSNISRIEVVEAPVTDADAGFQRQRAGNRHDFSRVI